MIVYVYILKINVALDWFTTYGSEEQNYTNVTYEAWKTFLKETYNPDT